MTHSRGGLLDSPPRFADSRSCQRFRTPMMTRIFAALCAAAFALMGASCTCCTSEPEAPGLRPLPQFQEMPAAEVEYTK